MEYNAIISQSTEGNKLIVAINHVPFVIFEVSSRFTSNDRRRPKNFAVYVGMVQLVGYANCWAAACTIPKALEALTKLGVPTCVFLALLRELKWGDQIPNDLQSSFIP